MAVGTHEDNAAPPLSPTCLGAPGAAIPHVSGSGRLGLNLRASPACVGVLKRRRIQPKDASQLISVFSISCGEHQSAKCGACRGGGMEGVMPAPPAQEIKASAAAAALPASKALVPHRPVSQRGGCFLPTASMVVLTISNSWFDVK